MPLPFPIRFLTPWSHPEPFPMLAGLLVSQPCQVIIASTDSLTQRLERFTGAPTRVRLENQELQPRWEEAPGVWAPDYRMRDSCVALMRNAWLAQGDRDLVFAHSQLTLNGLAESTQLAIQRGEQPLGSLFLARDERMERHKLQLAAAHSPALALRQGLPPDHLFVCRRSLFIVAGELCGRILELFLTDLSP